MAKQYIIIGILQYNYAITTILFSFEYFNKYAHLDIQFNAFLLVTVDLPHTVQPFGVTLGPIRRQDGARGLGQLPSALS